MVVTVFTGVFQLFILAIQVWVARTATRYAGDATIAAKESVKIADRSMKIANRAYLALGQWQFEQFKENASSRIHFFLMNSGNTPAKLIAGWYGCEISKTPPPRPDYDQLLRGQAENVPVPGKGEVFQTTDTEPIAAATVASLQQGEVFLYIYGCFIYNDVFGDRHSIEFLVWYDYLTKVVTSAGGQERNHSE